LHEKFNINLNMDTQGIRYYPTNKHLTKWDK
jgi:hypothetical protein